MAEPQALACSLVIFGMVAGLALAGGLLQVVRPRPPDPELPRD